MEISPNKCSQCGAPVKGKKCAHCGAVFQSDSAVLFLSDVGSHRKQILDVIREMAEFFYSPKDMETTRILLSAISAVEKLDGSAVEPPLRLLSLDSLEILTRWKGKIEENGGKARIEKDC